MLQCSAVLWNNPQCSSTFLSSAHALFLGGGGGGGGGAQWGARINCTVMSTCWKDKPEDRPTFESLQWQLEDFFVTDDAGYTDPDR